MGGKEREREPPPATDDEDATQATTQEGDHAGRRRGGVIRQAQPTAQHHQLTAGLASGAKRRAAAMSQGERATKRVADQQRRRREQRESKESQPAPITFDAAVAKVASEAALGVAEVEDFRDWLLDPQQAGQPINGERITEWRASEAYERARLEYLDGCMCEGACTCTYDGVGIAPDVPGVTCDYFDEALLEPRANDTGSHQAWIGCRRAGMASRPIGMRSGLKSSVSGLSERSKTTSHTLQRKFGCKILRLVIGASPPVAALPTFATAVYKLTRAMLLRPMHTCATRVQRRHRHGSRRSLLQAVEVRHRWRSDTAWLARLRG